MLAEKLKSLIIVPDTQWVRGKPGVATAVVFHADGEWDDTIELTELTSFLPAEEYARIIAVLPAIFVTHLARFLPHAKMKKYQSALGYAVEDLLVENPDKQSIAVGSPDDSGECAIRVSDYSLLLNIVARFAEMGIPLDEVVTEIDILPNEKNLTLAIDGTRVLMRHGHEGANWPESAVSQLEDYLMKFSPEQVSVYLREAKPEWAAKFSPDQVHMIGESHFDTWIACMAQRSNAVNLLQGDLTPIHRQKRLGWGQRVAGITTGVAGILAIYFVLMANQLESRAQAVQAETRSAYQVLFPEPIPRLNVRRASELRIAAYNTAQQNKKNVLPFAEILADITSAWQAANLMGPLLKQIQYSADNREAYVDIDELSVPLAEAMLVAFRSDGYVADIVSVSDAGGESGAQVIRFRVRAGAAM
ncbi:type II secretion system protein GspL [Zhongshania marina]|uniref:Type II secretion system protein L n=1 Tax=Zhongshania marina TaxID=2304603 RepID=A0A2S4HC11_9GAMM|nr:type II secretion system protein GspL [Marortus luteolus]POP51525.1 hypothetical protein C0068_16435 [Marortus luteolus]